MQSHEPDERGPVPPEEFVELRVHGVGGTPPEEILDVPATRLVAGDERWLLPPLRDGGWCRGPA